MQFPGGDLKVRATLCLLVVAAIVQSTRAGECVVSTGADVILAEPNAITQWGTVDGITGYSFGTVACNIGDQPLSWVGGTAAHPVFVMNLYRLKNGRFEQVGMSWAKHGFGAQAGNFCCACDDPGTNAVLGVGCSDAYGANLNGNQAGINGVGGLGPRSSVNPYTGQCSFPYPTQGQTGDAIYKRLQVHNDDLDPALNANASYFGEIQIVSADDSSAGNQFNNVAFMPIAVQGPANGGWLLGFFDAARSQQPAIYAWKERDPNVMLGEVIVPGDGKFIVGSRCTEVSAGIWEYEYAVYNMNVNRAAAAFAVPIYAGTAITARGAHHINHHSSDPFSNEAWTSKLQTDQLIWQTQTVGENPNANALRWGMLHNFRFRANAKPKDGQVNVGLFLPGSPSTVAINAVVPDFPINTVCADARTIGLGTTLLSNAGSSQDGPALPCVASSGNVVWFKYTSTFTGPLRIATCNQPTFDTAIAVYSGCSCDSLQLLKCNDQACGDGSRLTVNVQAGQCYFIQVAGVNGSTGIARLRLTCPNANFAASAKRIYTGMKPQGALGASVAGTIANTLVIGAPNDDTAGANAGRAFVASGTPLSALSTFTGETGDQFGFTAASGCDCNGDGVEDVIIGAPGTGMVYAYSGVDDSLLWSRSGNQVDDGFGSSLACIGDLNGDGKDEIAVGAPHYFHAGGDAGRVIVLNGDTGGIMRRMNGRNAGDQFGTAIAAIGDVDGDGKDELAIGAPGFGAAGAQSGRVYIYSTGLKRMIQNLDGIAPGDQFGSSIDGLTYVDGGDLKSLVVIGSIGNDGSASILERIHAANPCPEWLCQSNVISAPEVGLGFAQSVAIGNVTDDEALDVLIGAPLASFNGNNAGAVYLYDGRTMMQSRRVVGEAAGDQFGFSLSILGDRTHKPDWIAGAPHSSAGVSGGGRAYILRSKATAFRAMTSQAMRIEQNPPTRITGDSNLALEAEMAALLAAWGECYDGECPADLAPMGGDGIVNSQDVEALLSRWSRNDIAG